MDAELLDKFLFAYRQLKEAEEAIKHQHAPRMSNIDRAQSDFIEAARLLASSIDEGV